MTDNCDAQCLFCGSGEVTSTSFEDTVFNEKRFAYLQCKHCKLVYVHPLPTFEDYTAMYPIEYQGEVKLTTDDQYHGLLTKIQQAAPGNKLLDYGCGNGRFVVEALDHDFDVSATEFSSELVKKLQASLPKARFYTSDMFFEIEETFDVIFMSNVLEHLSNPRDIIAQLTHMLNPNGILVLEGPVENNFSLALMVRKLVFGIRKRIFNKCVYHPPRHVLFANGKNQKAFLESFHLQTLDYHITEAAWPFPASRDPQKGFKRNLMYYIARVSILLSESNKDWGNLFTYLGRKTQ